MSPSIQRLTLSILMLAGLSACGGGGSTDAPPPPIAAPPTAPTATAVTGKVIDGYLNGATVCLDLNANQACDATEPTTTSGAGGAYSLVTTGLDAARVTAGYVLAKVPDTARDEDDAGLTLAAAGKKGFTLVARVASTAGAPTATMVTPLSTLVAQQMVTAGLSAEQATLGVRGQLGLATTGNLNVDYKASGGSAELPALARLANVAAVALGEVQAAVNQGAAAGTTDRAKLLASWITLRQNLGQLQLQLGLVAQPTANVSVSAIQAALLPTTQALRANAASAIAATQSTLAGTAAPLETLLAQGFGATEAWNGNTVRINVTKGSAGTWVGESWQSLNGLPFIRDPSSSIGWQLAATGWVAAFDGGTYTLQTDGRYLVTGSDFGPAGAIGAFRTQDVSGSPLSVAGIAGTGSNTLFPPGSLAIWGNWFLPVDRYVLRASEAVRLPNAAQGVNSLSAMVAAYRTPVGSGTFAPTLSWNGLQWSFDDGLASTGTLSFRSRTGALLGSGRYEQRTVNGVVMLVVTEAPLAALNDAAQNEPSIAVEWGQRTRPIFAVQTGAVYQGSTTPAGLIDDGRPSLNRTALNAVLASRGQCQLQADNSSLCPGRP